MKDSIRPLMLLVALLMGFSTLAQIPPPLPPPSDSDSLNLDGSVYVKAERMPVFPGACEKIDDVSEQAKCTELAIVNHIARNTVYSNKARRKGLEGRVFVEFVIGLEGEIIDIKVIKGVHPTLDSAAVAAVKTLPYIIPASIKGEPVKLKYTLPVNFKLSRKN